ncbi:MAG TPA: DMT family protein [Phenylobacterium sp.]|nr:DMT family protein [Phenylobacterium sp.]
MSAAWTATLPILMLIGSNVFMTFAWYGQLKVEHRAMWVLVLSSWGVAFFEYCLAVPANRIGRLAYDPAELKAMQEVITLAVFAVFSVVWLKEAVTPNHLVGFALIALGAFFVFKGPF